MPEMDKNAITSRFFAREPSKVGSFRQSRQLTNNVLLSVFFRGTSAGISLLIVPLTLKYMSQEKYGIWLTLSSIVGWFSLFDIGFGSGLRNKLSEALARGDQERARIYVSTAYAVLSAIACVLCVVVVGVVPLCNWASLLNAPPELAGELGLLAIVVFLCFSVRFVTSLINVVLAADQRIWITQAIEASGNALTLVAIFVIIRATRDSLLTLGVSLSAISAFVPLVASLGFFSFRYRWLRPAIPFVRPQYFRELASLGGKFFCLQITFVLQFSVQNILISQLIGASEVTAYNIAFRYFGLVIMFYSTAMTPLWSAFTAAYARGDIAWIKSTVRRVVRMWYVVALGGVAMLLISPYVYQLWVGDSITVDYSLSLVVLLFVLLNTWNTVFTLFVNGIGKVRLQITFAAVAALMNIPLAYFLVHSFGMGSTGVVLATVVCMAPNAIVTPLQYRRIVQGKAQGIWNA